jgi:cytochrome b561
MEVLQKDSLWLRIHFYCGVSAVIFTFFGFIVAVVATKKQGDLPHFKQETHQKAGLTIFLLVILQGLMGYFRPSPNPPKETATKDDNTKKAPGSVNDTVGDEGEVVILSADSDSDEEQKEKSENNQKKSFSVVRQYWEYIHRFLGITLLGLAWYNCQSGIVLQAANYEQDSEQKMTNIFWGITGTIAAAIFMAGYVIRVE